MRDRPSTIKHPRGFAESAPPGFDGVFDWSWTLDAFAGTKIQPMDIDAIVERNGQFLIFETKDEGVQIPRGQMITLERLHQIRCVSLFLVWGKERFKHGQFWYPACSRREEVVGVESAKQLVRRWFAWASQKRH